MSYLNRGDKSILENSKDNLEGAIRIFRIWKLIGSDQLGAITNQHVWGPGINECDSVPGLSNNNGFYGFNKYDEMRIQESWGVPSNPNSMEYIGGSMLCWGRCIVADRGARVEYARIESIIEPKDMSTDYLAVLPAVADKYGVAIIGEDEAATLRAGLVPYREGMEL